MACGACFVETISRIRNQLSAASCPVVRKTKPQSAQGNTEKMPSELPTVAVEHLFRSPGEDGEHKKQTYGVSGGNPVGREGVYDYRTPDARSNAGRNETGHEVRLRPRYFQVRRLLIVRRFQGNTGSLRG